MDMYISVQNKLSRVFFEKDFKTIVDKTRKNPFIRATSRNY